MTTTTTTTKKRKPGRPRLPKDQRAVCISVRVRPRVRELFVNLARWSGRSQAKLFAGWVYSGHIPPAQK